MPIEVLLSLPNALDATSLYRGLGPWHNLRRQMRGGLTLNMAPQGVSWASLKAVDILFMQRPYLPDHLIALKLAKDVGRKVWIDYDDFLYSLPPSNPAQPLYEKPEIQNCISEMIAKADIVSVSTPHLGNLLAGILKRIEAGKPEGGGYIFDDSKIRVIPNAYDEDFMTSLPEALLSIGDQNAIVSWRGSGTHDGDLYGVTPQLVNVVKNHLDWTYQFIGQPFWLTIQAMSDIENSSILKILPLDPTQYLKMLKTVKPALMIVPLDDCHFNRSKSNIAWLEATHAGAVTLAPDFEEWKKPGILTYKDPADFERLMESFLRGEIEAKALWAESAEFIQKNLLLNDVNRLREEILEELIR